MKKRYVLTGLIIVAILLILAVVITNPHPVNKTSVEVSMVTTSTFTNAIGDNVSFITQSDSTAIYYGPGFESGISLIRVDSEAGFNYTNAATGLVVWSQNGEIAVTKHNEVIFIGSINETGNSEDPGTPPVDNQILPTPPENQLEIPFSMTWYLTSVTVGEVLTTPAELEKFSITFNEDGTLSGTTDCNNFGGQFLIVANKLSFKSLFQTKMACEDSEEAIFIGLLENDFQTSFDTKKLVLVDSKSATTITFTQNRPKLPPIVEDCYVGGCSNQVCSETPDLVTTCEFREEYACYASATCERQLTGSCGWTVTPELTSCLLTANNSVTQ